MKNKLLNYLAKSCHYAQEHIDDLDAWDNLERPLQLTCVSYQVACFLAQNTIDGLEEGVESDIILDELVELPLKSENQWEKVINQKAKLCGGFKK